MPLEGGGHAAIEPAEFERVFTDEMRAEFLDAGADTVCIGGKIKRSERADLTEPDDAGVGGDFDHGAIEDVHRFAAGPLVAAFMERQIDPVGTDAGDFHGRWE